MYTGQIILDIALERIQANFEIESKSEKNLERSLLRGKTLDQIVFIGSANSQSGQYGDNGSPFSGNGKRGGRGGSASGGIGSRSGNGGNGGNGGNAR